MFTARRAAALLAVVLIGLAPVAAGVPAGGTGPTDGDPSLDRRVDAVTAWVAGPNATIDDPGDVRRLRAADRLVRSEQVALGDTLVLAVEAHWVEDWVAEADDPTTGFFDAFAGDSGTFRAIQTAETVRPEQEPFQLRLADPAATTVVPDADNDTYYLVVDTAALRVADDRGRDHTESIRRRVFIEEGIAFALNFTHLQTGPDARPESVTTTVTLREPAVTLDVDRTARRRESVRRVRLEPRRNQQVTGNSTLAPGRQVTVRIDPEGAASRAKTVEVGPEGTFRATFDLSALPDRTNVTVSAVPVVDPGLAREPVGDEVPGLVDDPDASIGVADQETTASESGRALVVANLSLSRGGFVVFRRGSVEGPVLGVSEYLPPGEYTDLTVRELALPEPETATVVAVVHRDGDDDGEFDYTSDPPFESDGTAVRDRATVTVRPSTTTTTVTTATTTATTTTATATTATVTGGTPATDTTTTGAADGTAGTADGTAGTTADRPTPGFGTALALVAVLVALVLARRRA